MSKIVLEDFNEGDGYYKVNLAYLNKEQVEEIEALVSKWNPTDEDIKNCIALCLTDANEQRFKDYNTTLKDCLDWLEKQKDLDKMIVVSPEVWDKAISDAFENGKREGEKQKEQKPLHWRRIEDATTQRTDDGCCVTSEKMLVKGWINDGDYRIVDEGTMVNRDILCIPVRELNAEQKEQKLVEKQDYSGLNDLEKAIHRGFLAAGVENVPVTIIKETAKDCLAQTGLIRYELPEDFEEAVFNVVNFMSPFSSEDELREISHRFAEQLLSLAKEEIQKSTWSEGDENMLNEILENYKLCIYLGKSEIEWIESLKHRIQLQPKQEWSEEDEDMLNSCISSIEEAKENRYAYKETDGDTSYDHEIAWLKSLRPRPNKSGAMGTTPPKFKLDVKQDLPVYLEEEIQEYLEKLGGGHGGFVDDLTDDDLTGFAHHFYELGINARKK